jgi:hypothetical protein
MLGSGTRRPDMPRAREAPNETLVGWQISLSNRRFIRRSIIPILARTLKPLKPSKEELEAALADLTKLRHKIGRKLSSHDLLTALA